MRVVVRLSLLRNNSSAATSSTLASSSSISVGNAIALGVGLSLCTVACGACIYCLQNACFERLSNSNRQSGAVATAADTNNNSAKLDLLDLEADEPCSPPLLQPAITHQDAATSYQGQRLKVTESGEVTHSGLTSFNSFNSFKFYKSLIGLR